jgi:hypothetical protein
MITGNYLLAATVLMMIIGVLKIKEQNDQRML